MKGPGREASPQGGPHLRPRLWVVCRGGRAADGLGGAHAEQSVIGHVWNGFGSGRLSLLPNRPGRQPSPQGRPGRREELPDGLGVGRLGFLPVRAVSIRVLDTSQNHDQSRRGKGGGGATGGAASLNHLAGFWLVFARWRSGRLFPLRAWPGLDYSCGPGPPGIIVRVILRAHMLQDSHVDR